MDTKLALVTNAHSLDLVTQRGDSLYCTWLHPNRTRPSPGPIQRLNKPLHRLSIQHVQYMRCLIRVPYIPYKHTTIDLCESCRESFDITITCNAVAKQDMRDAWMKPHRIPNSCDGTFTGERSRKTTPYDSMAWKYSLSAIGKNWWITPIISSYQKRGQKRWILLVKWASLSHHPTHIRVHNYVSRGPQRCDNSLFRL